MKSVVIVTGANGGIGFCIVNQLLEKTDHTVLATFHERDQSISSIQSDRLVKCQCDISKVDSGSNLLARLAGSVGEFKIAGLINNAGVNRDSLFLKLGPEQWREVIETNLNAMYNLCHPVVKYMIEKQPAEEVKHIINISSIIGEAGGFGQTNYSASKAGILGFTKSLAQETARYNIMVNAIAPGFINTPMTAAIPDKVKEKLYAKIPLGRFGEPTDIANTVLFILSTSYATGSVFDINGGLYM